VAIPLTLPMGWAHSPPYFCAFTELVADMANAMAQTTPMLPVHPLYHATQQVPLPQPSQFHPDAIVLGNASTPPICYHDVYIDDFISMAQPPLHTHSMNILLHTIDMVFDSTPHPTRRQAISESKLAKGDASFSTTKRILGWDVDTYRMHLSLPSHRLHGLTTLLNQYALQKRTSRRKWAQLLGGLRSLAPALYGASHLFSILQHALTGRLTRVQITPLIRTVLHDWLLLVRDIHTKPTPLHAVVPMPPTLVATTDASQRGLGGAWKTPTQNFLWRTTVPPALRTRLITDSNPTGSFTINDLELAASIIGATLACHSSPALYHHLLIGVDNTAACAWLNKGSTSSSSAPAFLLHQLARLRLPLMCLAILIKLLIAVLVYYTCRMPTSST
jgi:hypothetical protein